MPGGGSGAPTRLRALRRDRLAPRRHTVLLVAIASAIYNLTEVEYVESRRRGVTPPVIAHMQTTYTQSVEQFPGLAQDTTLGRTRCGRGSGAPEYSLVTARFVLAQPKPAARATRADAEPIRRVISPLQVALEAHQSTDERGRNA
jgi:hypothetical protein